VRRQIDVSLSHSPMLPQISCPPDAKAQLSCWPAVHSLPSATELPPVLRTDWL
jgi:hypothetical protein